MIDHVRYPESDDELAAVAGLAGAVLRYGLHDPDRCRALVKEARAKGLAVDDLGRGGPRGASGGASGGGSGRSGGAGGGGGSGGGQYMTASEICDLLAIDRSTLWRRQQDAGFPRHVHRVGRRNLWLRAAVFKWIDGQGRGKK